MNQAAFGVFMGAIAMAVVNMATIDWKAEASADEPADCRDKDDRVAYMARLPGEAHTTETCVYFIRYGDPAWVPVLGDPTVAGKGIRGKPGKEQQLKWVRDMCRKLAREIKQRC